MKCLVATLMLVVACGSSPTPPPASAGSAEREAPSASPVCGSDESSESECGLPSGAIGWCDHKDGHVTGMCKAICPKGYSYASVNTSCNRRCGSGCKTCRTDESLHITACDDPGSEPVAPTP